MSLSHDSFSHGVNPAHVDEVLRAFLPRKDHTIHDLPTNIGTYRGRLPRIYDYEMEESNQLQPIASRLGQEVYAPFTYAPDDNQVLFLVDLSFPTKRRNPYSLNLDHKFQQPSLREMMDVWIGILQYNGYDRDVARCFLYNSVCVINVLPITGSSRWATTDPTGFQNVIEEIAPVTNAILKRLEKRFPNLVGHFAVSHIAFRELPRMLQGTGGVMLNKIPIMHPSMINSGFSYESTRSDYLEESAQVLSVVTNTTITISEDCKSLIHVPDNHMNGVGGRERGKKRKEVSGGGAREWGKKRKEVSELRWDNHLEQLLEFKDANGHTNVPRSTQLGRWVNNQRYDYKLFTNGQHSKMKAERATRLKEIGFGVEQSKWDNQFEQLLEFKKANGHTIVPDNNSPGLGRWVKNQRYHYRLFTNGQHSQMTAERALRLQEIDFCFVVIRRQREMETVQIVGDKEDDDSINGDDDGDKEDDEQPNGGIFV